MRVTIDLMKKSTQIIDLSDVINPRVGDDDLLLPLHIVYGDNQTDMRGKDVEFISEDTNKQRIYVGGTCNTDTPGDNLYMGNLTFRFPAGTFKADGTYDPDKTMFRIVDKATQKVISSVNVKITVMKNSIEFDFDPDKTSYDSRLETMLHDFHDKGQTMLDEIKDLNNQAKSNVSGDTATTANQAKQQADANAGDISDLKGEVTGARGRFADMAGREDAQDAAINQKESVINANANYAALKQKDAQQDAVLAQKAGKFELEDKLAQMSLEPEAFENETALKAKYPNGKPGLMVTVDTGHKWLWVEGTWTDCGAYQVTSLGLYSQLPGVNLIDGTSTNAVHVGPGAYGKDSNVIDVSHRLFNKLTWSFNIKNLTGNAFVKVKYLDIAGKYLKLDGSIGDNAAQYGIATGYIVRQGTNLTHFEIPADAKSMVVIIACDTETEFDISSSMLTYGSVAMPWSQSLNDCTDPAQQIARLISNLGSLINNRKVDTAANPHLNLLHISSNVLTHAIGSHDSEWIDWLPEYGSILTYSVELKHISSVNNQGVYFTIRMVDGSGIPIDLSGKEITGTYTNVVIGPEAITTNTKYIKTITLPANVARLSMTITTANENIGYDYCHEMIIAGTRSDMPLGNFNDQYNLIPNTHNWKAHIGPGLFGKNTDWFDVTGGEKLFWSITIANATDAFYPAILLKDSQGNQINLDGTAGNNQFIAQPLGSKEYTATNETHFEWVVSLPENAAEAALVIQFKSDKLELDYSDEMANYTGSKTWEPRLSDLSKNEQIEHLIQRGSGSSLSDITSNLTVINLGGNTDELLATNKEVTLPFTLKQPNRTIEGYAKMQWQGNSSLNWAKKGFKLKTYQDADCTKKLSFKPQPSYPESSKWHLKGYMTDRYTVRDSTAADIYADFIVNNPTAPEQLLSANHYGTIQSTPVLLYMNNQFYGLMELNTKSGGDLWNIADTDDTAMALESNGGINSNWTTQNGVLNGADYEVQAGTGKNGQALLSGIGKLVAGMSDTDFVANFEQYINLNSALDYVIFNYWINNDDSWGSKNIVYLTYDGKQTYLMSYDFDSTMMASWVPGKQIAIDEDYFSDDSFLKNNLLKKIITLMPDKLMSRFNELDRLGVLDPAKAAKTFRDKANAIGSGAYTLDRNKWETQAPDAYSDKSPDIDQIAYMFVKRKQLLAKKLKELVANRS